MGKFAMVLFSGLVIGFGSLNFVFEVTNMDYFVSDSNLNSPEGNVFAKIYSLVASYISRGLSHVASVLIWLTNSKIRSSAIQSIIIFVINFFVARGINYKSVKQNLFGFVLAFRRWLTNSIKVSITTFHGAPFMFSDSCVVSVADCCKLSLSEWYQFCHVKKVRSHRHIEMLSRHSGLKERVLGISSITKCLDVFIVPQGA